MPHCSFIKKNNERCRYPSSGVEGTLCTYHAKICDLPMNIRYTGGTGPHPAFELPDLTDPLSIAAALTMIGRALLGGVIDARSAGTMTYILQTSAAILKQLPDPAENAYVDEALQEFKDLLDTVYRPLAKKRQTPDASIPVAPPAEDDSTENDPAENDPTEDDPTENDPADTLLS